MTTRTTMQKRQKELARMEKRRDKEAKRAQRKLAREQGIVEPDSDLGEPHNADLGEPPLSTPPGA